MKKIIARTFYVFALAGLALTTVTAYASGPAKPNNPEKPRKPVIPVPPGNPNHHNAPFDGGITLLIGSGIAYGIKKAYDKRAQRL
jgi:hypothetical protein